MNQHHDHRVTDRVTVHDAARRLGISEDAVRMRVKRGTLEAEREGGRLYVLLTDEPTVEPTDRTNELIAELRDRVRSLESQLDHERDANRENRRIIAGLTQRIPELPPVSPGPTPPASHTEGPAARYAAAIALIGIILATGFSLITGSGYWGPWNLFIGPILLIVLWAVPLDWIGSRVGGYTVWSVAFGLCLYVFLAFPYAWVLATVSEPKMNTALVQETRAFEFGGIGIAIAAVALGVVIGYWRTHREPERAEGSESRPDAGAAQTARERPWWRRMFGG